MIAFVIRRLLQGVVVMLVVGFIAFSLFNFVGDPVSLMLPPEATQADRQAMREHLGIASIGLQFEYQQVWLIDTKYSVFFGDQDRGSLGNLIDRDNVSFTVKRTF